MKYESIDIEHPDIELLVQDLPFKVRHFTDGRLILSEAVSPNSNGYYLRTADFKAWSNVMISKLKASIKEANEKTDEFMFEFWSTSDYEVEFNKDRVWEASFSFGVKLKDIEVEDLI